MDRVRAGRSWVEATARPIPFVNITVRFLFYLWDWYYSIATSGPPVAQRARYPYKVLFAGLLSVVISLVLEGVFFGILLSWPVLDASMLFVFGVGGVVAIVMLTLFFTNFGPFGIQAHGWLILSTVGLFFIAISIWMPVTNVAYLRLILGGELHRATPHDVVASPNVQAFHFIDGVVTPSASACSWGFASSYLCALAMYDEDQPTSNLSSSYPYNTQLYYSSMPFLLCTGECYNCATWSSLDHCFRVFGYPNESAPGYLEDLVGVRTTLLGSDNKVTIARDARSSLKDKAQAVNPLASIANDAGIVLHTESGWKDKKDQMWMDWWGAVIGLHAFLLLFPCTCGLMCLGFQFNDWDLSLSDLTHDERTAGDFELRVPIRDIIARRRLRGVWQMYMDEERAPLTGEFPSYLQTLPLEVMERIMMLAYGPQGAKIQWDEDMARRVNEKTKLLG